MLSTPSGGFVINVMRQEVIEEIEGFKDKLEPMMQQMEADVMRQEVIEEIEDFKDKLEPMMQQMEADVMRQEVIEEIEDFKHKQEVIEEIEDFKHKLGHDATDGGRRHEARSY